MHSENRAAAVYVSVDMEGCADVVHWDEVRPSASAEYERARTTMTLEVNAVADAAFAAGAGRVVVNDSHSVMRNLDSSLLDPRVEAVTGASKPFYMLEAIDQGFDAAFFVGYHGAIGDADAVMGHTYSPRVIFECRLGGEPIGEMTINAALAGAHGVPVALVSGDRTTTEQARRTLPWAVTVETKASIGYFAAECLSPATVRDRLRRGVTEALARVEDMRPLVLPRPTTMEIDTQRTSQADLLELYPGMQRLADRTVAFTSHDIVAVYRALTAVVRLGSAA